MLEATLKTGSVPLQLLLYFSVLIVVPALIVFANPLFALFLVLFLSLVIFFTFYLELGLLLMIFLNPFIDLQLVWKDWNVPVVDAFAIILFFSFCFHFLLRYERGKNIPPLRGVGGCIHLPLLAFFLLFLLSLLPSFLSTPHVLVSLKYLARPLIFFYLMFIFLPVNIVRTDKILLRAAQWSFWTGMIVASMGVLSFLFPPSIAGSWPRALPISFWGFSPLGTNHNLIAETLVSIIPLAGFLVLHEQSFLKKKFYTLGLLFFIIISLLTFSRAGWLVLGVEGIIFVWFQYKHQWINLLRSSAVFVVAFSILAAGMYFFQQSGQTERSNANRLLLNEIAVSAWKIHPIIGNGLNTFQGFVAENSLFNLEFGPPLEAHGMIQKILVETGIIGTLSFLLFLGAIFFSLFKCAKRIAFQSPLVFFTIGAFGVFIFELFNTSYFVGKMWLPIGLALAASNLLRHKFGNKRVNTSLKMGMERSRPFEEGTWSTAPIEGGQRGV